jgi:serine/threonine protein kinase
MEILDAITADGEIETDNKKYFKERMYINSQVGIIHRDLKPTNILVSYFSETHIKIKLIDWAFSKRTFTEDKICGVYCGTINY